MIESNILNLKNKIFEFSQNKMSFIVENSSILRNIDSFILFFITLTILLTTVATSDIIGLSAIAVFVLTAIKMFTIKGQKIELTVWDAALLIYLVFCVVSTINSTLFHESLLGISKTFIYLGFYFSILQYLRYNPKKVRHFIFLIALICSAESVIGIIQSKIGVLSGATWQDTTNLNPEEILERVFGTLKPYNPNLYGGFVLSSLSSILVMVFLNLKKLNFKRFLTWLVMLLAAMLAIFYSGCRGAYLGLGSIALGFVFLSYKIISQDFKLNSKIKKIWWGIVSSVTALTVITIASVPAFLKRILSIFTLREDSSTSFRMNVYQSSIEMLKDNLLFGIGVGNKVFREIYGLYMMSGFDALSAYCIYLETALESGIFALISYLLFIGLLCYHAMKFIVSFKNLQTKIVVAGCLLTLIGLLIHGFVDTVYFRPQIQIMFWTTVAILSICITSNNKIFEDVKK